MLTSQTLKKLGEEQKKLDDLIRQNYQKRNNVATYDKKASLIRIKIALLVEIGELANELKTFKHWKSQKEVNWKQVKEELIDCLHFYLSWANSWQIDFSDYKFRKLVAEPDYNELLLALFSETESFSIITPLNRLKSENKNNGLLAEIEVEKNKGNFYRWLIIFEELAEKIGMKSQKEMEEAYMAKNKINWERQRKNY